MARSKNATALFEVIHTAKKPPKASPTGGGIPAPKWWAKGGKSAERPLAAAPDADDADDAPHAEPSGGTRRSWLAAARQSAGQPQPTPDPQVDAADDTPALDEADPSPVYITRIYPPEPPSGEGPEAEAEAGPADDRDDAPVFSRPPAEPPVDRPSWADRRAKVLSERATPASDPAFDPTADVAPADLRGPRAQQWAATEHEEPPPARRPQRVRRSAGPTPSAHRADVESPVALDRSAGEVRFRLSYGGAVAAAAILLIVILIAYLAGRQRSAAESVADGIGRGTSAEALGGLMAAASSTTAPVGGPAAVVPPPAATAAVSIPPEPAAPAEPVARQVGLMYVVIQSYPDRDTAARAGEFLNRNGVPCTVIPGLSGFALRDWYSVVGLQPFARGDHRPPVAEYLRHVTALGPKFSTKVYNQFQPQMYTWRADSDAPRP